VQFEKKKLVKGDLLIEKSGGGEKQLVGCVVYFDHDFDAVCSNFVARMPVDTNLDARYWSYAHAGLYAGKVNYPAIKQTTGIQNLDSGEYLNTRMGYPPLEEQQQIAAFLDSETAKLDALFEKVNEVIASLIEYRTALITAATTGKIDVRKVKIPNRGE
jgi:type I restriction enzyme S subunit